MKKLGLDVRSILVIALTLLFPFSVIASPSSSEKLDSLKTWDTLVPIKAKEAKTKAKEVKMRARLEEKRRALFGKKSGPLPKQKERRQG